MSWWTVPLPISGFVLAGGRSSRMGQDKALLELAGKPLVEHALIKLRRMCADVAILSNNSHLARFGTVVEDLHPDCGPMGGIEAALAHAKHDWSLILPVDLPFLPTQFLRGWAERTLRHEARHRTRIAMFQVDGVPQPTLLMIHREMAPYLTVALAQGRYKLFPMMEAAADDWAQCHAVGRWDDLQASKRGRVLEQFAWTQESRFSAGAGYPRGPSWTESSPAQEAATHLYFANLNTPQEFAEAETHLDVLDT